MLDHSQPMTVHHAAAKDDANPSSNPAVAEALDHISYEETPSLSADHQIAYDDTGIIVDGDSNVYLASEADLAMPLGDVSNQLTLTFRGQVYVFDSVTPNKVQAVLLLLGGCEIPSGLHELETAAHSQKGSMDFPGRSSTPQRVASLNRFRQKRKERCFDKKVRYSVRQEVALRMHRNKGQFTSSKKPEDWVEEVPQETLCTHCGIDSKSTPMMRRGPSGPRSLCNACGLFWANRGTLRDLSKKAMDSASVNEQVVGQGNESDCGNVMASDCDIGGYSNGDSMLLSEKESSR